MELNGPPEYFSLVRMAIFDRQAIKVRQIEGLKKTTNILSVVCNKNETIIAAKVTTFSGQLRKLIDY